MNVLESIEEPRPVGENAVVTAFESLAIPLDTTEWVTKDQLRQWIVETVDGLNWDNPELTDTMRRYPSFEPRQLLCSVAFAYLMGTFGAEDIVRACSRDPEFKTIRPKLPPLGSEFSAFRKLNRGVINLVLVHVLTKVLKTQFADGDSITTFPAGLRRTIVENALERLNIARHMDRAGEA